MGEKQEQVTNGAMSTMQVQIAYQFGALQMQTFSQYRERARSVYYGRPSRLQEPDPFLSLW
jgi:hypothetical protein